MFAREKLPKLMIVILGFLGGLAGGVIPVLVRDVLLPMQPFKASSTFVLDSDYYTHGKGSLKWVFEIQPERRYLFSRETLVGSSLHVNVLPDEEGNKPGIDLRGFKGLRFAAEADSEFLSMTEFNLFVGPNYIQYRYAKAPIVISTKWKEFNLDLSDFVLAPWDKQFRAHLVSSENFLSDITAFGFDMKTQSSPVAGSVWIDNVRGVGHDNQETLISDCEDRTFRFQGKRMNWRANRGKYSD